MEDGQRKYNIHITWVATKEKSSKRSELIFKTIT